MYPQFKKGVEPRTQLLVDIGYSYALIERVKEVLKSIRLQSADELVEAIEEFQGNRLQLTNDIYNNADAALQIDRRLAALDKILAAEETSLILPNDSAMPLLNAINEAKEITGKK